MIAEPVEIYVDPESETGKLLAQAKGRPLRLVSGGESYRVEAVVAEEGRLASGGETKRAAEEIEPVTIEPITEEVSDANDPWANYDPERARAAVRALADANIFAGVDLEELKRELKEQRGQHSVGRPEW